MIGARGLGWLMLLCGALAPSWAAAQSNVTLEIVTEPNFAITGQQKWLSALKDLGVANLKIRAGKPGDRAAIKEIGSERAPSFVAVAILTKDKLQLPGGSFSMHQAADLKAYLAKIGAGKANEPKEELTAFGLTPEQLIATHELLTARVSFSTKDKSVGEIARKLVKEIEMTIDIDADARKAIDAGEAVLDELQGMSLGTALAATLRPAGCVFAPVRSGRDVRLRVADSRAVKESWPVGWPSEKGLSQTLPKLGKFLNVDIADTPLSTVVESIQARSDAPFLFDHNGLARNRVDMTKVIVKYPATKTYYKKVLDSTLYQARLKCEVRTDEAGTPFVWISPLK